MNKKRGRRHTTTTETTKLVLSAMKGLPNITMIAPGEIDPQNRGSKKFITVVHTTPGCELIISGQGSQKVAVHTTDSEALFDRLCNHKKLKHFEVKERKRMPDV